MDHFHIERSIAIEQPDIAPRRHDASESQIAIQIALDDWTFDLLVLETFPLSHPHPANHLRLFCIFYFRLPHLLRLLPTSDLRLPTVLLTDVLRPANDAPLALPSNSFTLQQLCFPTLNAELASYQVNGIVLAIVDRVTR
jgi:hypothetical protein